MTILFLATKSVSGKDFKDLAWDNYILRMKGQETVSKLFDVLVKIFHMKYIRLIFFSGDFHDEWYMDRLLGKVKTSLVIIIAEV